MCRLEKLKDITPLRNRLRMGGIRRHTFVTHDAQHIPEIDAAAANVLRVAAACVAEASVQILGRYTNGPVADGPMQFHRSGNGEGSAALAGALMVGGYCDPAHPAERWRRAINHDDLIKKAQASLPPSGQAGAAQPELAAAVLDGFAASLLLGFDLQLESRADIDVPDMSDYEFATSESNNREDDQQLQQEFYAEHIACKVFDLVHYRWLLVVRLLTFTVYDERFDLVRVDSA